MARNGTRRNEVNERIEFEGNVKYISAADGRGRE